MAKDISIDIKARDILFQDVTNSKSVVYETSWGNVLDGDTESVYTLLNIIVPIEYQRYIKYGSDNTLNVLVHANYYPQQKDVKVRFLTYDEDNLIEFTGTDVPVSAALLCISDDMSVPSSPKACELPLVNVDGNFLLHFDKTAVSVKLYSASQSDLDIELSDNQSSQLLVLCAPGKYYRYPTTGVAVYDYLNSVVAHSDLADVLTLQFQGENRNLYEASFDSDTGQINLVASAELTSADDNLDDVEELELDEVGAITGNDFSDIIDSSDSSSSSSGSSSSSSGSSSSSSSSSTGTGLSSLVYDSIDLLTSITLLDKEYQEITNNEKIRIQNEVIRIANENARIAAEKERVATADLILTEGKETVEELSGMREFILSQVPNYVYEDEWAVMTDEQKKSKLWYVLKGTRAEAGEDGEWTLGGRLPITLASSSWKLGDALPINL